ncbi:MAG: RluA family pseudouridine synthase [Acidobacteria bacterium]|nr:RluA family pseudouridine synthase [Acidobacteriota bacterium]MBI3423819.1 RluA family pseudouridine synthase [Acidobacteriota bacterium]
MANTTATAREEVKERLAEDDDYGAAAVLALSVPVEADNQRLDLFLVERVSTASRSAIQRAITGGEITVNDRLVKPSHRLTVGEFIAGTIPQAPPIEAVPEDIPLNLIYEDDTLIVINKPAGMVTHPGAGVTSGTLANALVHHLQQQAAALPKRGGVSRPGIVHRLDVGTSGLIVVAKTDQAHLHLAEQFEARTVSKNYLALVYGNVKENAGRIEAPLGRDPRSRVKMAVVKEGRSALTLYQAVERFAEFTLLEVEIKTGRTHQIRVHLAYLNHPVVADTTYDAGRAQQLKHPQIRAAVTRLKRPFLHAARLSFTHPATRQRLDFTAPLPAELSALLDQVRNAGLA